MNLDNVEELFLSIFDFEKLKEETKSLLIEYLKDEELIPEFEGDLPPNTTFKDLTISYRSTTIILKHVDRKKSIFRIRYSLSSSSGLLIFWYDAEFDFDGYVIDEYFDSYLA